MFTEFLANFGDKNRDGKISKSEWNDFYAAISSGIENDSIFEIFMAGAWKLN